MSSFEACLVHICPRGAWEAAAQSGMYRPASLESEGFIHLSSPFQVLQPANALYSGRRDLLLLWIRPRALTVPLKWEAAEGDVYPHLYGPLSLDAVGAVTPFLPDEDGVFRKVSWPEGSRFRC